MYETFVVMHFSDMNKKKIDHPFMYSQAGEVGRAAQAQVQEVLAGGVTV